MITFLACLGLICLIIGGLVLFALIAWLLAMAINAAVKS